MKIECRNRLLANNMINYTPTVLIKADGSPISSKLSFVIGDFMKPIITTQRFVGRYNETLIDVMRKIAALKTLNHK